ncbi:protein kinase C-binding protein NELL2-like isoform X2 [Haemaphysalis longicornis]
MNSHIPVRADDIPLEAVRFIAPYMHTWPPPPECCANGGTCIHGENGSMECACPAAFSGPQCLDDVDECLAGPCGRFSVCVNLYGSFRCLCRPGFQLQGHLCVREVSCEEGPCLNGGTCVTRDDLSDVCYCKIGFRGRLCERAVPECSSGSCPRGTFCVSTRRGFRCLRSLSDLQPGSRVPALGERPWPPP